MKSKVIRIEEPKVLGDRLLLSRVSFTGNVGKYFRQRVFQTEYDVDIGNVDASILNIPVLGNLITVAWAVGADVYVKELDKSYFEALNEVRLVFKRWYPKLSFSMNIYVEKLVSNEFSNVNYGLLFSGGVDSLASYIRHRSKKPNLIMIWGADIPLSRIEFWKKVKSKYQDFAEQEGVEINFVKTNLHEFINEGPLNVEFARFITGSWWGGFYHGIALLSLCAPLTIVKNIGTLLIASSINSKSYGWGSHWLTDNKLTWGNLKIYHDGGISRQEKIKIIKRFIINKGKPVSLRVCYSQFRNTNCGKCEKCRRTILGLILENIDPNKCGFKVDDNFFEVLKRDMLEGKVIKYASDFLPWYDIKKRIPKEISHNFYNCKEFFRWFREFDLREIMPKAKLDVTWFLFFIYYKLFPNEVRSAVAKLLRPLAKFLT